MKAWVLAWEAKFAREAMFNTVFTPPESVLEYSGHISINTSQLRAKIFLKHLYFKGLSNDIVCEALLAKLAELLRFFSFERCLTKFGLYLYQ